MTLLARFDWRAFVSAALVLLCLVSAAHAQDSSESAVEHPANQSILIAAEPAPRDQGVPARNYALGGAGAIVGGGLVIAGGVRVIRGASGEEGFGGGIAEGVGYMTVLVGTILVGSGIYLVVKALNAQSEESLRKASRMPRFSDWSVSPCLSKSRQAGLQLSVAF